jgi:perosamine synthetase
MSERTLSQLPRYWTIGAQERLNLKAAMKRPLSGYIGGKPSEGYWVNELSDRWRDVFGCAFAVPCNSGTSGLMAACLAADLGTGDEVWVSSYTMSATATCAMMLGCTVKFMDIEPEFFCLITTLYRPMPKAIIVTNLFGCTAMLPQLRSFCDQFNIIMIEDNAQAPFATCGGAFAGIIGHMGVFSLNVHKHLQCGEGGVIVTNDPRYGEELEWRINHGELAPTKYQYRVQQMGGNFRMTEPIAAIACGQLAKGAKLVQSRIALAEKITYLFKDIPFVIPPAKRFGEVHSFYMWAGKIDGPNARDIRLAFVTALKKRGVPFQIGYSKPLHKLFGEIEPLPVVEEMENDRLFTFEICAYDPRAHHLKLMRDIILEEADEVHRLEMAA